MERRQNTTGSAPWRGSASVSQIPVTSNIKFVCFSVLTTDGVYGLAAPDSEPTPVRDEL